MAAASRHLALRASAPTRRIHHRLALILLIKLGMVALLLVLPAGVAISFGAAHAAVLLLVLAAGAGALVIRRRRGSTSRPGPSH